MRNRLIGCLAMLGTTLAVFVTTAVAAQHRASADLVTVEGCLVRKADLGTHIRSTPERVTTVDRFVLTRAKMIKGTAPSSLTPAVDIEEINDGLLASYVGQRVQIDGRLLVFDVVEMHGSEIRAIAKDCGAP